MHSLSAFNSSMGRLHLIKICLHNYEYFVLIFELFHSVVISNTVAEAAVGARCKVDKAGQVSHGQCCLPWDT